MGKRDIQGKNTCVAAVRRWLLGTAVVGVALGLGLANTASAIGPTCSVNAGGGGDFLTISGAVANPACTEIDVAVGVYNETVTIGRPLRLIGAPGAVVRPLVATDAAIYVNAVDGVIVQGFEIDGTGATVHNGIYFFNSNNSSAWFNVVHDVANDPGCDCAGMGILFFGWGQGINGADVSDNTVYNCPRMGIFIGGLDSSGWPYLLSSNNIISMNVVHDTWTGPTSDAGGAVQINAGSGSSVDSNSIQSTGLNQRDIYLFAAYHTYVLQNTITHSGTNPAIQHYNCSAGCGQTTGDSHDLAIDDNTVTVNNPAGDGYAVDMSAIGGESGFDHNQVTLTGTPPPSFYHGLNLGGSGSGNWGISGNTFEGNNLGANSVGIRLRSSLPASSHIGIECNRVEKWANGISSDALPDAALVIADDNIIAGNSVKGFLDAGSVPAINAKNNWWGCSTPGSGCNGASVSVTTTPSDTTPHPCVSCSGAPSGASCNDNQPCTTNDQCDGSGNCASTPVACPAPDQCHVVGTCNTQTGLCSNPTAKPNGTACNDGNACTVLDKCLGGQCIGVSAEHQRTCDDHNPCTDDSCNPLSGCMHINNTASCSDGNACSANDRCSGGQCAGGTAVSCDDHNPCTADACSESSGCTHTALPDQTQCSDGTGNPASCFTGTCCSPALAGVAGVDAGLLNFVEGQCASCPRNANTHAKYVKCVKAATKFMRRNRAITTKQQNAINKAAQKAAVGH